MDKKRIGIGYGVLSKLSILPAEFVDCLHVRLLIIFSQIWRLLTQEIILNKHEVPFCDDRRRSDEGICK